MFPKFRKSILILPSTLLLFSCVQTTPSSPSSDSNYSQTTSYKPAGCVVSEGVSTIISEAFVPKQYQGNRKLSFGGEIYDCSNWADTGHSYEGRVKSTGSGFIKFGYGHYDYNNGSTYRGYFDGGPDYYGIWNYSEGSSYEGEINDGKKHGVGTYKNSNGSIYEGTWQKSEFIYGKFIFNRSFVNDNTVPASPFHHKGYKFEIKHSPYSVNTFENETTNASLTRLVSIKQISGEHKIRDLSGHISYQVGYNGSTGYVENSANRKKKIDRLKSKLKSNIVAQLDSIERRRPDYSCKMVSSTIEYESGSETNYLSREKSKALFIKANDNNILTSNSNWKHNDGTDWGRGEKGNYKDYQAQGLYCDDTMTGIKCEGVALRDKLKYSASLNTWRNTFTLVQHKKNQQHYRKWDCTATD